MAIVETAISIEIVDFMTKAAGTTLTPDGAKQVKQFADDLAGVIANAIKSATVTVNPGIPVATTGSPAAQTGATTATGTGTLS